MKQEQWGKDHDIPNISRSVHYTHVGMGVTCSWLWLILGSHFLGKFFNCPDVYEQDKTFPISSVL